MMPEIMKQSTPENYIRLVNPEGAQNSGFENYVKGFAEEINGAFLKY